ncbi:unnamed protein product [Lymnaea stagnalis]|uniref:Protein YIPF n=1 Tax=Lymnaea stagnalis TaxID=6523 RepID=A0AAV2ILP7_LYMST
MVPRPGQNYLVKDIRPNPDLYGPFWICTTLVFTTAIAGNLANYFSAAGKFYKWQYDFHKVTFAATAIFSYWWLIPLILFGILWWRGSQAKFSFLEMLCIYGYSLAIYIPISVLWAIQVSWLQWTLVVLGAVLSGSVLLITFWPAVSEDNKKIAIGLMVFIFIMHAALAAGFVLYFFYVPSAQSDSTVTNTTTLAPTTTTMNSSRENLAKLQNPVQAETDAKAHTSVNDVKDISQKSTNRENKENDGKRESKFHVLKKEYHKNDTDSSPGRGRNVTARESLGKEYGNKTMK